MTKKDLLAKCRKALQYHDNGDPVKDVMDDDDFVEAIRLLVEETSKTLSLYAREAVLEEAGYKGNELWNALRPGQHIAELAHAAGFDTPHQDGPDAAIRIAGKDCKTEVHRLAVLIVTNDLTPDYGPMGEPAYYAHRIERSVHDHPTDEHIELHRDFLAGAAATIRAAIAKEQK